MSKNEKQIYHYVYRITNKILNKHYYGLRSSYIHPKKDLGIKYFSSSTNKDFIIDQKNNKNNYKYKIIQIYYTRASAALAEIKLHKKFNVAFNESFYNLSNASSLSRGLINTYKQWENYTPERKIEVVSKIRQKVKEHFANLTDDEKKNKMKKLEEWKQNNPDLVKGNYIIAAEKRRGKNNGSAKQINIFNKNGELVAECHGNFGKTCEEIGVSHHNLKISLQKDGMPIYNSKFGETTAKKFGKEEFIGWFAKYKQ